MATTRCQFCWHPGADGHNEGCPTNDPKLLADWEKGRDYGFGDSTIKPYEYQHYPKPYILGYRAGKAEIDDLVDEAAQSRYC